MANEVNWLSLINSDVNCSTDNIVNKIKIIIEKASKVKKIRKNKKRQSWITNGLIKSCNHKNYLYEKWLANKQKT